MVNVTQQPIKGLYVLGAICFELVRFPAFLVTLLIGRQHPAWTFRQAISVHVLFSALWHIAKVQMESPLPLKPGAEKERFVVIKPAKSDAYKGPLRSNKDVVPVEIGATWYPAPLTAGSDKSKIKVVLHTHRDVLTSYLYLLNDLQIPANNITISGDSAGGNLTMSLLRYIAEYGAEIDIPVPVGALLWSPWVDPSDNSCSYVHNNKNYATDYLSPPFTAWGTNAYAGPAGEKTLSLPYVTHKYQMFKSPVPMFVNVGGSEILYFEVVEWTNKMKEAGNDVVLDIEHAPHDILALGAILGFEKEAESMARKAGEWMKEH